MGWSSRLARRRSLRTDAEVRRRGLSAFCPQTQEQLLEAAARTAFQNAARLDAGPAFEVTEELDGDVQVIAGHLGRPVGDPVCRAVLTMIEGLAHARTLGVSPLSLAGAEQILELSVRALTGPRPPDPPS